MIRIFNKFEPIPGRPIEVDTTSRGPFKGLSPFYLGPCIWSEPGNGVGRCEIFENLWQYSKVYPQHTDVSGNPTPEYFAWRKMGFAKTSADRYPMGKGAKPLYSLFGSAHLDYIISRKLLYIPWYAHLVQQTKDFGQLKAWYDADNDIALRDFDGYNYESMGMTLRDVVNNHKRPMGHAFVLKMILTNQLEECLQ